MKPVRFSKDAIRTLRRMPRTTAERIHDKVAACAAYPASQAANGKALKGEPGVLRLRVGDWRVIFEESAVIAVIRIGRSDLVPHEVLVLAAAEVARIRRAPCPRRAWPVHATYMTCTSSLSP